MINEDFKAALESCDVNLVRKMWNHIAPNMPQPGDDLDVLSKIHYARTIMKISFRLRAYSNQWLLERHLPSGLPDYLKPRAQRMYPVTVSAVGISIHARSKIAKAIAPHAMRAMQDAVLEAYEDGKIGDSNFVKARIMEAKTGVVQKFLGRL